MFLWRIEGLEERGAGEYKPTPQLTHLVTADQSSGQWCSFSSHFMIYRCNSGYTWLKRRNNDLIVSREGLFSKPLLEEIGSLEEIPVCLTLLETNGFVRYAWEEVKDVFVAETVIPNRNAENVQ